MPFAGKLKRGTTVTFEVQNTTNSTTATTTLLVNKRDRITDAEPNTIVGNAPTPVTAVIGDRIDRVIFMVAPTAGQQTSVRVNGGAAMTCDADTLFMFDTEA